MPTQNARLYLRWIRTALVVGVNGWFACSQILEILDTRAKRSVDPVVHFDPGPPTTSDYFFIVPLIVGIIVEFVGWRPARFVNVGYWALLAAYMPVGLVLASNNLFGYDLPEHWAMGVFLMGFPAALFAVLLWWLYRQTRPPREPAA